MDDSGAPQTRRSFLTAGISAAALAAVPATRADVDLRSLISRGDLIYDKPAARSEAGAPIGNGRMGSLAWTTPSELRFQINRVDVYGNNSSTNSFIERNTDYCGGCGYVEIDFGGYGEDPFPASGFAQRLSLYEGLLTINGKGITSRILALPAADVLVIAVEDSRAAPDAIQVNLRMLRPETVRTRSHLATSHLHIRGARIALTQEFREGDYYCKSAVAVGIAGRDAKPRLVTEAGVRLAAAPSRGAFQILVTSAASFDPKEDVLASALDQLEAASAKGFPALARETAGWWRDFWSRGFVSLHSSDGVADLVERNYHYFLYLMAASSRGKFPPKFNGMIWNTGGDLRTWGAQHWFANLSCYYEALFASNRLDLMDPMFDMYSGMYEACRTAARQQWGSEGMYIPETCYFDGLEKLPDDIAAEMRDLYLMRKPWDQRTERFREYARHKHAHSSRWNWIAKGEWVNGSYVETERGFGPFGNVSHILGTTAKVAYLYWRRYEYTLDRGWLSARAYPMLKAASEFYRNFPNLQKESDGKYHIHYTNSNESVWGGRDSDEDLCAMRGVVAAAIRAAELLNEDAAMRATWKEFLANLAPLPTSDDADAIKPDSYRGPRVWVRARKPAVKSGGLLPDGNSLPAWFFDLCSLESSDREMFDIANSTLTQSFRGEPGPDTRVGLLSKVPIAAATLGRTDAVRYLLPNQLRGLPSLVNRMSLREGPQALDAEALGRAAEALHMSLLQSNPTGPGEDPVIRLGGAWPRDWDATFTLRARGAFLVTSSIRVGRVEFVEIHSLDGADCKLRNPWGEDEVTLYRDGRKSGVLKGSLLKFSTRKGEKIVALAGVLG